MEVAGTESYDVRENLKADEEFIKKLLGNLEDIAA
jgi:hypothetical protein